MVASALYAIIFAGYNDKYRITNSYYVGTREKQAVRNVAVSQFMPGFTHVPRLKKKRLECRAQSITGNAGEAEPSGARGPRVTQNALD